MSNKSIDKHLDIILLRINDVSSFNVWNLLCLEFDFDNSTEEKKHQMLNLSRSIENLGLTYKYFEHKRDEFAHYRLTEKGIKVKTIGGHLKYHKNLDEKSKQSDKKEKTDLKLSEWKLKTFWWIFCFALIGFGLSSYNLINSFLPSKEVKEQEEQMKEIELKLEKLQTLIFELKRVDSSNSNKILIKK